MPLSYLLVLCFLSVTSLTATESAFDCRVKKKWQNQDVNELRSQFEEFIIKYRKIYPNELQMRRRFEIFRKNMARAAVLQEMETGTALNMVPELLQTLKFKLIAFHAIL